MQIVWKSCQVLNRGVFDVTLTDIPYDAVNTKRNTSSDSREFRVINKGVADELTFNLIDFLTQIVPECLFDKTVPCRFHPCCEAQNVSCCHACIYRKCPSRCEKGTKK